jgi:hypothetical protein
MLPRPTDLYCKQIAAGLDGNPQPHSRCVSYCEIYWVDRINAGSHEGKLWASYQFSPTTLIKTAVGTSGRGDRG